MVPVLLSPVEPPSDITWFIAFHVKLIYKIYKTNLQDKNDEYIFTNGKLAFTNICKAN